LIGKPKGKRSSVIPRRRWDNIKIDLQEIGWEGTGARRGALVNKVMTFRFYRKRGIS
jgi:hypothetical protein